MSIQIKRTTGSIPKCTVVLGTVLRGRLEQWIASSKGRSQRSLIKGQILLTFASQGDFGLVGPSQKTCQHRTLKKNDPN